MKSLTKLCIATVQWHSTSHVVIFSNRSLAMVIIIMLQVI